MFRTVDRVARRIGVAYFLAGATARDLLLHNVFGLAPGRRTLDVDFGFAVSDWQHFTNLKAALAATGEFEPDQRIGQRLYYRGGHAGRMIVDIIPFGGIEENDGTFAWPPAKDVVMNVTGFAEGLQFAVHVSVAEDLILPVISIPGLAVLKVIAWNDRRFETNKDASDLHRILGSYWSVGNEDVIYTAHTKILERFGFDIEITGAYLLGHDAAKMAGPQTSACISAILNDPELLERLVGNMLATAVRTDEEYARNVGTLLIAFKDGFLEGNAPL